MTEELVAQIKEEIHDIAIAKAMCDEVTRKPLGGSYCYFLEGKTLFKVKITGLLYDQKADVEYEEVEVTPLCQWCWEDATTEKYLTCFKCGCCYHETCNKECSKKYECVSCKGVIY